MNAVRLGELLTEDRIRIRQTVASKKKALELIAEIFFDDLASQTASEELTHSSILNAFVAREKLGSTALEHGIAIPHCRCDTCSEPMVAVVSLANAIDFGGGNDDIDVDLICGLLVPAEESQLHLDILAALVKKLGVEENREAIRSATSVTGVYEIMSVPEN